MTSLQDFLTSEVTLDNCDREPIHLSGAIHNGGAFASVNTQSRKIVAATATAAKALGRENAEDLLGRTLAELAPGLDRILSRAIADMAGQHVALDYEAWIPGGGPCDLVCHITDERIFLEWLPCPDLDVAGLRTRLRRVQSAVTAIASAPRFEDALEIAANTVRAITGFARVDIYRFLPDWSGEVIAESREPHMPGYRGLFFPDGDIPRQARHLYRLLPHRAIPATDDAVDPILQLDQGTPIDLTWSLLRSTSRIHTAYLRNMGVQASFSSGLKIDGELWGLIACHHDTPGFLPFDVWGLVSDLGTALMARRQAQDRIEHGQKIEEMRRIEASVAEHLGDGLSPLAEALAEHAEALRTFLDADGFALKLGDRLVTDGVVPPDGFIEKVIELSTTEGDHGVFATSTLPDLMPEAAEHRDVACGVIVQPIKFNQVCKLVWFRGHFLHQATWAGDPKGKMVVTQPNGTEQLMPRRSFQAWRASHDFIARPWTRAQIEAAREVFTEIINIVASQQARLAELEGARTELEAFTRATVHDVRAPLRSIAFALKLVREAGNDGAIEASETLSKMLDAAELSSERLRELSEQLLEYLSLRSANAGVAMGPVDLREVASYAVALNRERVSSTGAQIAINGLPVIRGERNQFVSLFDNLISNALKYRVPDRAPLVEIAVEPSPEALKLVVADNGMGIPEEHRARVLNPFERLVGRDEIEGAGLGLSICDRVARLHGGRLNLEARPEGGTRAVITLPLG